MAAVPLTGDILKLICPSLTKERADSIADRINFCAQAYKFDTADNLQEFVAQLAHESGEFTIMAENMNYSKASLLMANWPKHFPTVDFANQYIRNPEKLGNYIYGQTSIAKDLGNIKPEDGYALRGSGWLQMTGRDSITKYMKYVGLDELGVEGTAEKLRTEDYWACDAACWEFAIDKKLVPLTLQNTPDSFKMISRRINGGDIGLADRQMYYQRAMKYLK